MEVQAGGLGFRCLETEPETPLCGGPEALLWDAGLSLGDRAVQRVPPKASLQAGPQDLSKGPAASVLS